MPNGPKKCKYYPGFKTKSQTRPLDIPTPPPPGFFVGGKKQSITQSERISKSPGWGWTHLKHMRWRSRQQLHHCLPTLGWGGRATSPFSESQSVTFQEPVSHAMVWSGRNGPWSPSKGGCSFSWRTSLPHSSPIGIVEWCEFLGGAWINAWESSTNHLLAWQKKFNWIESVLIFLLRWN